MPRFSAHIGYLFTELNFYARFAAAARAGFGAVEHPAPHQYEIARIQELLAEHGLEMAQIGMPAGDASQGEKGLACLPDRHVEFEDALAVGIANARALKCRRLHMMAGIVPEKADRLVLYETYLHNLTLASEACAEASIRLIIEPISDQANPGYFLNRPSFAVQAIAESGATNAYLLYDIYHAQNTEGAPTSFLEQRLPLIKHVHIADHPGRHEPGTGKIDYGAIFFQLDALGYRHWVGCEYVPSRETASTLGWMTPYLARSS